MKRKFLRTGSFILTAVMLCACTGDKPGSRGIYEGDDNKPTQAEVKPVETPVPTEPAPEPGPEPETEGEWSSFFANGQVIHNGYETVLIGDKLYFREYDPYAIERTVTGNVFLGEDNAEYSSMLSYYDIGRDEVKTIAGVYGSGHMYATEDGFLIADGRGGCNLIRPDGIEDFNYYNGVPVGVSDDGKYVAIAELSANGRMITNLYSSGELIADTTDAIGYSSYFVGFAGDTMLYSRADDSATTYLYGVDPEGVTTELGWFIDYDGEAYPLRPEQYGFVSNGSDFAIVCGYYDGAVHYLNASIVYTGNVNEENSLQPMVTFEDGFERSLFLDQQGNILWGEHAPDEVGFSDYKHGTVGYYTDTENFVEASYDNFITWPDDQEDRLFNSWDFVQEAFKYGDKIFLTYAECYRIPEEDFGSTMAFNLTSINHVMIDMGELKDGRGTNYFYKTIWSDAWDQGNFTLNDIQGEWIVDRYTVEGSEEVPADNNESMSFIIEDDTLQLITKGAYGTNESDIAQWQTDDGPYYEGTYFKIPDDPSETAYTVVSLHKNKIQVFVSYLYDDGTYGSWYAFCHKK